jgi:hypothetical protein
MEIWTQVSDKCLLERCIFVQRSGILIPIEVMMSMAGLAILGCRDFFGQETTYCQVDDDLSELESLS